MTECRILLKDIKLDKNLVFINDTVIINDRRNKFTCYICMAKFSTAGSLAKHKYLHSESETEPETEDDLFKEEDEKQMTLKSKPSKPSPSVSTEKQHSNNPQIKSTETKETPKTTGNVSAEKPEENVSSEDVILETPFKCETCKVFFKTGDDAKLHKSSNKCKFSCKICKRKFNTLYAFVVHLMQHKANTEKNRASAQYTYKCTLCEKLFDDCYQLRRHENMTHHIKPHLTSPNNSDISAASLKQFKQAESTDKYIDIIAPRDTEKIDNELQSNAPIDEQTEIICDLCYDVFNSREELKCHEDFHKQLEKKSDTIIIEDDEDDVVEVIEDKSDPNEIKTTIKKTSLLKTSLLKPSKPSTSTNKYATLTPVYAVYKGPKHKSKSKVGAVSDESNKPAVSNQVLTATIKDMLTPTHEKQSKQTILLDNPSEVPTLIPIHKLQKISKKSQRRVLPSGTNENLVLRKTGPLSYSFFYKGSQGSPMPVKIAPAGTQPQVSGTGTVSKKNNNDNTVAVPTQTVLNTSSAVETAENMSSAKVSTNPNNYKFVIKSISNLESSAGTNLVFTTSSAPSNAQNTPVVTTLLPTVPSSGITSTQNFIFTANNNQTVQKPLTGVSNISPSFPNSSVASTSFAYVLNPTNSSTIPQIPTAPQPLTFTDPTTQITYLIIPHGNNMPKVNVAPSTVQTAVANMSNKNTETETTTVSTIISSSTEKMVENTTAAPVEKSNSESCTQALPQPVNNVPEHPHKVSAVSSSNNDKPYDIQMPLITNVTSLHVKSKDNDKTLPVITSVTSGNSLHESNANSSEYASLPNTSAITVTTTANSESISSYMISKPGPSTERDESAIIIDSDSSRDSKEENSEPTKVSEKKSGNDSDSNEAGDLIIDENTVNKNDANNDTSTTEPKKGLIFVRNITELMEPQNIDKKINQNESTDNEKTEKKEKKWKFPMNCNGCSVVFQRYRAMRNHNERKLKCTACDFKCCKTVDLKEHYILDHRKFFCGRCSFLASSKNEFKEHNGANHTCKRCNGLYANLSSHVCNSPKNRKENTNSAT